MKVRSVSFATGLSALAILLAGCIIPAVSDQTPTPTAPAPSGTSATSTVDASPSGLSLEGSFTYSTMDDFINAIVYSKNFIRDWIASAWPGMPMPRNVVYVRSGDTGLEQCVDSTGDQAFYNSRSYEYCGADRTIYLGQDMLWDLYTRAGDAGAAVGIAHEFGHHVQNMVGVPAPETASESIRHENQADCLAGLWVQYMDQHGNMEYPDDLEDINVLFPLIGSAEGEDRDHGTTNERIAAFEGGFRTGITSCNAFYPGTPLD